MAREQSTAASEAPLKKVIADALRADILAAHYTPGTPLPSEPELSARYSVSRPTVRDAVAALILEGLVTVVRGRGTFVRPVPDRHLILLGMSPREDIACPTFADTARVWGWTQLPRPDQTDHDEPTTHRISFVPADRETATILNVRPGSRTLRRYSLWQHSNRVRIEVSSYAIAALIPDWTDNAEEYTTQSGALLSAITQGRHPATLETLTTARMPYADERDRLTMEPGAPILLIRRVRSDKDGRPLEFTEIKASAEQFETTHTMENAGLIPDEVWEAMDGDSPLESVSGRILLAL